MSLGHFWAYVGQPHGHIDWAKSMPFASINSTNPRTHPAQFGKKILRIDRLAKWGFFESAILDFFFQKKKFFFCLIPWKIVKGSWIARMGRKFDDYPGFSLLGLGPTLMHRTVGIQKPGNSLNSAYPSTTAHSWGGKLHRKPRSSSPKTFPIWFGPYEAWL